MASLRALHVLVCLLGLFVLCHSDSFFQEVEPADVKNPPKGCVDAEGKQHDFGSEWVKDCMECSCTKEGLSCRSKMFDEVSKIVPDQCELVIDRDTCSAKMVLKADKTRPCEPF